MPVRHLEPAATAATHDWVPPQPQPGSVAAPLGDGEFSDLMRCVGPWEAEPNLAVAVSGGADSLALAHLAREWAAPRGGRVDALIVDHGLRPASAPEALQTAERLGAAGIANHVLPWTGAKPRTGLQAAARHARYRLMAEWCGRAGVLHLLVAHHAGDQAETVLLRAGAGSGFHGLAAMAAVRETYGVRLVRPLLGVPGERLRASVAARGGAWIDDPSNHDRRFARVRIRQELAARGTAGSNFTFAAQRIGRIRAHDEKAVGALLAGAAALHPAGFAVIDPQVLDLAAPELVERALGRVLSCLGGRHYPPRPASLGGLRAALVGVARPRARTLAGCRIVPWRGNLIVCREAGRGLPDIALPPGEDAHWDGRFTVRWRGLQGAGIRVAALGAKGWSQIEAAARARCRPIPSPVRPSLPAFWDDLGLAAVPHLGFVRSGSGQEAQASARFRPNQPFVPPYFAVASAPPDPI
jgi:tRNA(Ile)-lysidine synthase